MRCALDSIASSPMTLWMEHPTLGGLVVRATFVLTSASNPVLDFAILHTFSVLEDPASLLTDRLANGCCGLSPSRLNFESNSNAGRLLQVVAYVELRNVEVFSVTDFLRAGSMRTPMNSEGVFGKSFT